MLVASKLSNDDAKLFLEAARSGKLDTVHHFLQLGANPSIGDSTGSTPLILAAKYGHKDVVGDLIKADASLDDTDQNGYTALYHACLAGDAAMIELLVDGGADVLHGP
eukprot:gene55063-73559_t